jgi:hypothetical protein
MDTRTGEMYESKQAALDAGVPEKHIAEIVGEPKAVRRVARLVMSAVKRNAKRKAKRKMQQASRRRNLR